MSYAITTERVPYNALRILIADDVSSVRDIFRIVLARSFPNCTFDLACNGLEAVESFQKFHQGVVLMDLKMPVMDGLMAFDKISEFCEENKWAMPAVIFCPAGAPAASVLMRINMDPRHGYITKPVTFEILLAAVKARLPAAS